MISIVSPKTSYHNICDQTSVCNQLQLEKPEVDNMANYLKIWKVLGFTTKGPLA